MRSKPSEITHRRRGERGAALVMSLLIAMLLLAAGGLLVATAGRTASNAVDSTAEVQAYYAADAGLQAAMTVIRRNRVATVNGLNASFHNLACGTTAACVNDGNDLSQWLGSMPKSIAPEHAYTLTVTDPSRPSDPADPNSNLAADYNPRFLKVRSVGLGPKGAIKVMEMMVDRFKFFYDAPAALVLRESQDGATHVTIAPGAGGPTYSGKDKNSSVTKGAVGAGNSVFGGKTDWSIADAQMSTVATTGGVVKMGSNPGELPWPEPVTNAQNARDFVQWAKGGAQAAAQAGNGYYGDCPPNNQELHGIIVIENASLCKMGPGNSGDGFMVVTGDTEFDGSFDFKGLVFILGKGTLKRSGGGGPSSGNIFGGILAANFPLNTNSDFGAVTFDTNGGGGSLVQYDSLAIANALSLFGPRALGVVEK